MIVPSEEEVLIPQSELEEWSKSVHGTISKNKYGKSK